MNLDQYLKILESDEAVREDSTAFSVASGTDQVTSTVQAMQRHSWQSGVWEARTNGRDSLGSITRKSTHCFGCSQEGYYAKSEDCAAKNDVCCYCHQPGHWERCCFVKEKSRVIASEGMSKKPLGHDQVNHLMVSPVASDSSVGSGASESLMLTQFCDFYRNNYGTTPVPTDSASSVSEHSSVHGDGQEIDQSKRNQGKSADKCWQRWDMQSLDDTDGNAHLTDRCYPRRQSIPAEATSFS